MITPIRNLTLGNIKLNKQTNSKNNSYKQTNYSTNPNVTLPSFTGYLGQKRKVTFDWGVENNLFKLPIVTLEDGTEKQLTPDKSQQECAKLLCDGKNVLFDAPTGMGKTSVAHFAMGKNLIEGKKTVYTVPIKALANDKYAEFTKIYGEENVGILTGDRKINTNAPITIMTTEIFDNQAQGLSLNEASKIGTVIYDEAHYIGDEERGFAWEHSILNSASKGVQTLLLSATIGNAEELAKWIGKIPGARPTQRVEVPPENRPVPLVWHIYRRDEKPEYLSPIMIGEINLNQEEELTERQKQALEVVFKMEYGYEPSYEMSEDDYDFTYSQLKSGIGEGQNNFRYDTETFKRRLKKEFRSLDSTQLDLVTQLMARTDVKNVKAIHENWRPDDYQSLVKTLEKEDMLPAIIFKLAQRGCEEVADSLSGKNPRTEELLGEQAYKDLEETSKKLDLLTKEEKEKVQEILDKYEQNGVYLGLDSQKNMLLRGYAVHHAGRMPQYKKLVEELFSKKLIKVVVSTSTLGAGINMPARTVVMTNTSYGKFNPETKEYDYEPLSANEFHQMAGRAGRRGIDSVGHVVLYNLHTPPKGFNKEGKPDSKGRIDELWHAYTLMDSDADDVRSIFRPQPVMLANYFAHNKDLSGMWKLVDRSFKLHLSKDRSKVEKQMYKKFENFTQVLLKQGYIIKNNKKEITLTPKGEILTQCQGINPLMMASMLYDEKFAKLDPLQLCQVVGSFQGSSEAQETDGMQALVSDQIKYAPIEDREMLPLYHRDFESAKELTKKHEEKVLKALKEGNVNRADIKYTDTFSGMVTYLFAMYNQENEDSIKNFEKITRSCDLQRSSDPMINAEYERKSKEGNVYKIITGSIASLKQIIRICDFALSCEDLYFNTSYWETLRYKAQEALDLLDREPINNDPNYANNTSDTK